jgi:phosphotransferase system HPr-like phosphotransfer protein
MEVIKMPRYSIGFHNTKEMLDFVNLANKFEGEIDLKSGIQVVDGKSLMGVLAIAERERMEMTIYGENSQDLLGEMKNIADIKEIIL